MQGDETVGVWSVRGVAVWDARDGSLLHTLQVEGDNLVPHTDHPSRLLSLAFAEDVVYFFTESALLVVERCGDGPWLEETGIWRFRGPDLSLSDAESNSRSRPRSKRSRRARRRSDSPTTRPATPTVPTPAFSEMTPRSRSS